jgi:hypothetical protein
MQNTQLVVSNTTVNQKNGLYCLNDLHKASGCENQKRPAFWVKNKQTQELVNEILIAGIPAIESTQKVGTYVCKDLVYAYAMWISPKFHLCVIRAFDAMVTAKTEPVKDDPLENSVIFDLIFDALTESGIPKHQAAITALSTIQSQHQSQKLPQDITQKLIKKYEMSEKSKGERYKWLNQCVEKCQPGEEPSTVNELWYSWYEFAKENKFYTYVLWKFKEQMIENFGGLDLKCLNHL